MMAAIWYPTSLEAFNPRSPTLHVKAWGQSTLSNSQLLGPFFPHWYQYEEFLNVFIIYTSHHVFIKKEKDNKHFAPI